VSNAAGRSLIVKVVLHHLFQAVRPHRILVFFHLWVARRAIGGRSVLMSDESELGGLSQAF